MTWSISATGHGNEGEKGEKALLSAVVEAVEDHGGEVTSLVFTGNEVNASDLEEAKGLVEKKGRKRS